MSVLRAILKIWNALPPVFQLFVVLAVIGFTIYLISNRGFMDNLTHLLQAFPPIVYFPIAIRSASLPKEKEKPQQDPTHSTPTP